MMSSAEGAQMSLASLLLAFAPALAARFNPVPELEAENKRLKDELAGVLSELEIIRNRLKTVIERNADEWREAPVQRAMPNPLATPWQQQEAVAEQYRYQQAAQNLMAQQAEAQAQAWQNQQAYQNQALAQNQQLAQYQGLMGAQGLLDRWAARDIPNCTPSRSDAFFGAIGQ
jgi:hypothetical protein